MQDYKIQEIREQLESYLSSKGIDTRKNFTCLAGTHEDKTPSMSYDKKRNKIHCFSCNADMDIYDLIGVEYGLNDFTEQLKKASEITGIYDEAIYNSPLQSKPKKQANIKPAGEEDDSKYQDQTEYFKACIARVNQTSYLKDRGLTEETIKRFKLGYDPNFYGNDGRIWQAVIIPTSNKSYIARNTDPTCKSTARVKKYGHAMNYNTNRLNDKRPVFIVEGEIDALSIEQLGYHAIGLGGAGNFNKFINILQANKVNLPTLILALDNDKAGRDSTDKLAEELKNQAIDFTIPNNLYGQYKDANEALMGDIGAIKKELEKVENYANKSIEERQAEEYRQKSVYGYLQEFINGISDRVNTPYTPTGFNSLDETLDGGLYEGLYILGAISSLGKTTLLMQIADQIAMQGQDVLVFSLEMARAEIMAKSISRLTLQNAIIDGLDRGLCKTTRGITTGSRYKFYNKDEINLIEKSIRQYGDYAGNLFIIEGLGNIGVEDIKKIVANHIKITKKRPIVIIDYIQILAPYEIRATEKQATDKNVIELKRLSRDYKIPVFGISSFNRENYSKEVSMTAFKESGAIEYGSDVLIGLQYEGQGKSDFNLETARQQEPREIQLKILKNRNGRTDRVIDFNYYPMFNYFKEA